MVKLTEKDIEILDQILKITLEKGHVFPENLPPLNNSFLSNDKDVKSNEYKYYLDILNEYEVVEIEPVLGSGFHISPISIKTYNFYTKQGGFKTIYQNQLLEIQRKQEMERFIFLKQKWESKLLKWQAKTFWWIFIFACIGGLYGIYDLTTDAFKNKKSNLESVTKSQLETELNKLRVLISNSQKIDSIENTKFNIDTMNEK